MSGGYFNYSQHHITDIADSVEQLIATNNSKGVNEYGDCIGNHFSKPTIAKFKKALKVLRQAEFMAQRIDWLVSCDDGEQSFHRRWDEDLKRMTVKL